MTGNVFAPFGFQAVRRVDGAAWTANMTAYTIAANNTHSFFSGDPVVRISTGYIDRVAFSSGTNAFVGIFVGCKYLSTARGNTIWSNQFPGGDTTNVIEAYVIDDPNVVFRCQVGASAAAGGPVTLANYGENFGYQLGTGSTLNGISGAYLDFSNKGATSTLPFIVMNTIVNPPGVNGSDITTAGNFVEVAINAAALKAGVTAVVTA